MLNKLMELKLSLLQKRIILAVWFALCLILWVFTFRLFGATLMFFGWIAYIFDNSFVPLIWKTVLGGVVLCLLFMVSEFTSYELETASSQPCWSPDSKYIAFYMERDLHRNHPAIFSENMSTNIWKKYYLCTMDRDGKLLKVVKETNNKGRVLWPGNNAIVYTEEEHGNSAASGIAYKIRPDSTGLEELWKWDGNSEYQDVYWLTPNEEYLVLAKYIGKDRKFSVYDRKANKITKELSSPGVLYGAYRDNSIVIREGYNQTIIFLDTLKYKAMNLRRKGAEDILLNGYNLGWMSPDRSMSANDVFKHYNDEHETDRKKHSYLLNIFWK